MEKPTIATASNARVRCLDGIRGSAILIVLICHFWGEGDGSTASFLTHALQGGWVGVDVFFALSGFLITGILLRAKNSPRYFSHFYIRRTLRIFPLYFAFLITVLVLLPKVEFPKFLSPDELYYWLYLANLMPLHGAQESWQLGHFWSLAIEEQFYLAWPFVIFLVPTRFLSVLIPMVLVGAIFARAWWSQSTDNFYVIFTFTLTHLDGILLGSLGALLVANVENRDRLHYISGILLATTLFAIAPLTFWNSGSLSWNSAVGVNAFIPLFSLMAACGVVYVFTASRGNFFRRLAEWRILVFFGTYSYCLYIVHNPILGFVQLLASPGRPLHVVLVNSGVQDLLTGLIALGLSIGVSLVSWHLYEKWFLRMKPSH